jgi:hypothetical protein
MKKMNKQLQEIRKQAAGEAPPAPPVGKGRAVRITDKNKTIKNPPISQLRLTLLWALLIRPLTWLIFVGKLTMQRRLRQSLCPPVRNCLALRQLVQDQHAVINKLQCQLEFVLSFLGIQSTDASRPAESPGHPCTDDALKHLDPEQTKIAGDSEAASGQGAWCEVASRKAKRSDTLHQSMVTAVYVDQTIKKRHETSIIVSGMQQDGSKSDASCFAAICNEEFQLQPSIAFTKRLGKPESGKIQPLLIVLKQRDQAEKLISSAVFGCVPLPVKLLRHMPETTDKYSSKKIQNLYLCRKRK